MKVEHLALNIYKSDKMDTEKLITHLASAIDEDVHSAQEYKELYECAYGSKLTNEVITDWVKSMAVTDGSERLNGQKWTPDQCYDVGNKLNIDFTKFGKYEWYVVMNMVYSDYYSVAKSFNLQEDVMFFAKLAKAWVHDTDGGDASVRLYNYYFTICC